MKRPEGIYGIFPLFRQRSFRFLWASEALLGLADQMEFVVLAWLVLVKTNSPFLLGLFGALRFFGTLLAPFLGTLVDRYERRKLLVATRLIYGIIAATILVLFLLDRLEVWALFIIVGLGGVNRSGDQISRQALQADLLEEGWLMRVVALMRMAKDGSQMVGPLVGGLLLNRTGMGPTYGVIIAAYLTAAVLVFQVRARGRPSFRVSTSVWRNLAAVGGYIRKQEVVLALLLTALLFNVVAFPLNYGLMPVFARDVLGSGELGLAALLWAASTGAFLGTVVVASIGRLQSPGRLVVLAPLAWYGMLILFSQSRWLGASLGILLVAGVAQSLTNVPVEMLLLRTTSAELRGRVMGVRQLAVYGLPVSLLIAGALASSLGAPTVVAIYAAAGIVVTLIMAIWIKGLWRAV